MERDKKADKDTISQTGKETVAAANNHLPRMTPVQKLILFKNLRNVPWDVRKDPDFQKLDRALAIALAPLTDQQNEMLLGLASGADDGNTASQLVRMLTAHWITLDDLRQMQLPPELLVRISGSGVPQAEQLLQELMARPVQMLAEVEIALTAMAYVRGGETQEFIDLVATAVQQFELYKRVSSVDGVPEVHAVHDISAKELGEIDSTTARNMVDQMHGSIELLLGRLNFSSVTPQLQTLYTNLCALGLREDLGDEANFIENLRRPDPGADAAPLPDPDGQRPAASHQPDGGDHAPPPRSDRRLPAKSHQPDSGAKGQGREQTWQAHGIRENAAPDFEEVLQTHVGRPVFLEPPKRFSPDPTTSLGILLTPAASGQRVLAAVKQPGGLAEVTAGLTHMTPSQHWVLFTNLGQINGSKSAEFTTLHKRLAGMVGGLTTEQRRACLIASALEAGTDANVAARLVRMLKAGWISLGDLQPRGPKQPEKPEKPETPEARSAARLLQILEVTRDDSVEGLKHIESDLVNRMLGDLNQTTPQQFVDLVAKLTDGFKLYECTYAGQDAPAQGVSAREALHYMLARLDLSSVSTRLGKLHADLSALRMEGLPNRDAFVKGLSRGEPGVDEAELGNDVPPPLFLSGYVPASPEAGGLPPPAAFPRSEGLRAPTLARPEASHAAEGRLSRAAGLSNTVKSYPSGKSERIAALKVSKKDEGFKSVRKEVGMQLKHLSRPGASDRLICVAVDALASTTRQSALEGAARSAEFKRAMGAELNDPTKLSLAELKQLRAGIIRFHNIEPEQRKAHLGGKSVSLRQADLDSLEKQVVSAHDARLAKATIEPVAVPLSKREAQGRLYEIREDAW